MVLCSSPLFCKSEVARAFRPILAIMIRADPSAPETQPSYHYSVVPAKSNHRPLLAVHTEMHILILGATGRTGIRSSWRPSSAATVLPPSSATPPRWTSRPPSSRTPKGPTSGEGMKGSPLNSADVTTTEWTEKPKVVYVSAISVGKSSPNAR